MTGVTIFFTGKEAILVWVQQMKQQKVSVPARAGRRHREYLHSRQLSWFLSGASLFFFLIFGGASAIAAEGSGVRPAMRSEKASSALLLDIARAGSRLVAVGERGHIVYSDDAGKQWQQAGVPVNTMLTSVFFVDAQQGWAVGHGGTVLHSTDAGKSWSLQLDEAKADAAGIVLTPGAPLLDVWFRDAQQGFAAGGYGYFIRTSDGGKSWQDASTLINNPDALHNNSITASADGATVLLVGEEGRIYRSRDGGDSWAAATSPHNGSLFGVMATPDGAFYAYGLQGRLFRSADAGNSWQAISTGVTSGINGAYAMDAQHVLAVGNAGVVLQSQDGGRQFSMHKESNRKALVQVLMLDTGHAVAVGEGGIHLLQLTGQ